MYVRTKTGVYNTSSSQTLYLFVDVKTEGDTTSPHAIKYLEPLQASEYLTIYNGMAVHAGPVTAIGAGNPPLDQVQGVAMRHARGIGSAMPPFPCSTRS